MNKQDIWDKYVGRRITSDSEDFPIGGYQIESSDDFDNREYVEFFDLTEDGVTMRNGQIADNYYDLADISDSKYHKTLLLPYSRYFLLKEVEVRLKFTRNPNERFYYIDTQTTEFDNGVRATFSGKVYSKIGIGIFLEPSPDLNYDDLPNKYLGLFANWQCQSYKFNTTNFHITSSPIQLIWKTSSWDGEIATLIPNPADFLQLMLAMPIISRAEHGFNFKSFPEFISIERLFRAMFTCFYDPGNIRRLGYVCSYLTPIGEYIRYPFDSFQFFTGSDNILRVCVNALKLFSSEFVQIPANKELFSKIIYVTVPEKQCFFEMHYQIYKEEYSKLALTFRDSQVSHKIMEEIILPLLIENREKIKEFINSDSHFTKNKEVLCKAVDNLEDYYNSTTELTLGWNMQNGGCVLTGDVDKFYVWKDSEFE